MRVDNVGTIFMAINNTATSRTRHADAKYHFDREFIVNKFKKKIFVRSQHNLSDGFTKNVTQEVYNQHTPTYLQQREEFIQYK